jgi:hypothetical protein
VVALMAARLLTDQAEREIVRRYREGTPITRLAEEYRCSSRPITKALQKHDVKIRPGRPVTTTIPKHVAARERRHRRERRGRVLGSVNLSAPMRHDCIYCGITYEGSARSILRHAVRCRASYEDAPPIRSSVAA